jgi:hypothetical protein
MNNQTKALERQVADELVASFYKNARAWRWRDGDCDMVHGPGGICMSTSYFTIYSPAKVRFGFWNRRRIKRAVRSWKRTVGDNLATTEHHRALEALRRCLVEPLRAVA